MLDVEECDAIIKGLIRHVPKPMKGSVKAGRPHKFNPESPQEAGLVETIGKGEK